MKLSSILLICVLHLTSLLASADSSAPLEGIKIALLTADQTHDNEALFPVGYFESNGAEVTVIGIERGQVGCYNSDVTFRVEKAVSEVGVDDFDILMIPGGHSPEELRKHDDIVAFVREFGESGKITAAVCHGPQMLISAGLLNGKNATCVKLMLDELEPANVTFENQLVVVDGNLVTGKNPRAVVPLCVRVKEEFLKLKR